MEKPFEYCFGEIFGEHGVQLPNNASLSLTLKNAHTITTLKAYRLHSGLHVKYLFEAEHRPDFEANVKRYIETLRKEMPFIDDYAFEIQSRNNFPHSAGIASSASSMSALALCLVSLEYVLQGKPTHTPAFFNRASFIARLGSGSASRSVFGQWSTWGKIDGLPETSDIFASPLRVKNAPLFQQMRDAVLLVSSSPKKV